MPGQTIYKHAEGKSQDAVDSKLILYVVFIDDLIGFSFNLSPLCSDTQLRHLSFTGHGFAGHVFQLDARRSFYESQTSRTSARPTQRTIRPVNNRR